MSEEMKRILSTSYIAVSWTCPNPGCGRRLVAHAYEGEDAVRRVYCICDTVFDLTFGFYTVEVRVEQSVLDKSRARYKELLNRGKREFHKDHD